MARRKGKFWKWVKKTAGKVGKGVKNVAGNVVGFTVLLPYNAAMRTILRSKGVKPATNFNDMVQQFYNVVIKKRSNYETYEVEHLSPALISSIIKAVVNFFKNMKNKEKAGEPLSPEEKQAIDQAAEGAADAINEMKNIGGSAKGGSGGGEKASGVLRSTGRMRRKKKGWSVQISGGEGEGEPGGAEAKDKNMLLYLAIGAGVLFFLLNKRK